MYNFIDFRKKLGHTTHFLVFRCLRTTLLIFRCLRTKLVRSYNYFLGIQSYFLHILLFRVNPFWIELFYFIIVSSIGFLALRVSKTRKTSLMPKDFDLLFTSVSAATVSSVSTVEMEVFSNTQLVFITFLMLFGGEVFYSMIGLHLMKSKLQKIRIKDNKTDSYITDSDSSNPKNSIDNIELGMVTHSEDEKPDTTLETDEKATETEDLKFNSIIILSRVVLCYLLVVHIAGSSLILIYLSLISSANELLQKKGLNAKTFAIFTTVSSFANCGFVPTNENMMIFKKNTGLLLILIPQILIGNTLYPVCLRLVIWFLEKFKKRAEFGYMLKNSEELGYGHFLPGLHSAFLAFTVFAFIAIQFVLFCWLEWHSEATSGISSYQKMVGSLFQVMNSRHAGESVFDCSALSPAILVLFVLMMYLPPYTSFLPIEEKISTSDEAKSNTKRKNIMEHILFSQLSYLVVFIILICITEREKMKRDPLNFNVLNIVIELISAYGNVGLSMGYSCAKQIHPDGYCKDVSYGFVGKWSDGGKFIIILVMFFGRLKKFSKRSGEAWKLP